MKIIYSHWQASSHQFCDKEMAKLSNQFVKKLGYKTCLYTDKIGYDLLSDIDYDEIIMFDELLLTRFNKRIWSLGKILAMGLTQEPFIHLDFDFFLLGKINEEILKKDFFCLYLEPWITEEISKFLPETAKLENIKITNSLSHNFSIVGGQNFQAINLVCNKLIDIAILNYKNIQNMNFIRTWNGAVLFEQILIPQLLSEEHNIEINTIFSELIFSEGIYKEKTGKKLTKQYFIDNFIKNKMVHLHGNKIKKFNAFKRYLI